VIGVRFALDRDQRLWLQITFFVLVAALSLAGIVSGIPVEG
jgi:hypothetical protein